VKYSGADMGIKSHHFGEKEDIQNDMQYY
jgi:hypothetical protein